MIAFQVGGRAARDAFFLSEYPIAALPAMVIAGALAAIVLAFGAGKVLSRYGPERVVPLAFAASGAMLLALWGLSVPFRHLTAVLLYLHFACLGGLLVSGFWSFVNERFDPRTAKRQLGRIGAGGTVGGLIGGLIATQVGQALPVTAMIPILACFHLLAGFLVMRLKPSGPEIRHSGGGDAVLESEAVTPEGMRAIARAPYVRGLITLVLLVTVSEGLIDLVFKGRAVGALGEGSALLRFFGWFYTGVSLVTVVIQAVASKIALEKLGPARTAAALPVGVAAVSASAALIPGLGSVAFARAVESVFSNSLYRAGYEVLFNPVPARDKRAIKSIADVGAARVGDIIAASLAQIALWMMLSRAGIPLLVGAALCSVAAAVTALRLHAGYVAALERGLVSRAVQLDVTDVRDEVTRSTMLRSLGPLALSQVFSRAQLDPISERDATTLPGVPEPNPDVDPDAAHIADLRSRDASRVRRALRSRAVGPDLLPYVAPLLGWDDVAAEAIAALRRAGPETTEYLAGRLLDPDEEFTIRRRVPLVLALHREPRAVEALLGGLSDRRFEVRYRCGRALAHLLDLDPTLRVPAEAAYRAVLREVEAGAGVWEGRQLLDRMDDESWSPVVDEVVRSRANRSLEHVFTLLALVLPRQPLRIAFKGLHTGDPLLRGTALEYLESTLPPEIRKPLWPYLEDNRPRRPAPARSAHEALQALIDSNESIVLHLRDLEQKGEGPAV